jgi:hypothetical protein
MQGNARNGRELEGIFSQESQGKYVDHVHATTYFAIEHKVHEKVGFFYAVAVFTLAAIVFIVDTELMIRRSSTWSRKARRSGLLDRRSLCS